MADNTSSINTLLSNDRAFIEIISERFADTSKQSTGFKKEDTLSLINDRFFEQFLEDLELIANQFLQDIPKKKIDELIEIQIRYFSLNEKVSRAQLRIFFNEVVNRIKNDLPQLNSAQSFPPFPSRFLAPKTLTDEAYNEWDTNSLNGVIKVINDLRLYVSEEKKLKEDDKVKKEKEDKKDTLPTAGRRLKKSGTTEEDDTQSTQTTRKDTSDATYRETNTSVPKFLATTEVVRGANVLEQKFLASFQAYDLEIQQLSPEIKALVSAELIKEFSENKQNYLVGADGSMTYKQRSAIISKVVTRLRASTPFLTHLQAQIDNARLIALGEANKDLPKDQQVFTGKILNSLTVQDNLNKEAVNDIAGFIENQIKIAHKLDDVSPEVRQEIQNNINDKSIAKYLGEHSEFLNDDGTPNEIGRKAIALLVIKKIDANPVVMHKVLQQKLSPQAKEKSSAKAQTADAEKIISSASTSSSEKTEEENDKLFNVKNQENFKKDVAQIAIFSMLTDENSLIENAKLFTKDLDINNITPDQYYEIFPTDQAEQLLALTYGQQREVLQLMKGKQDQLNANIVERVISRGSKDGFTEADFIELQKAMDLNVDLSKIDPNNFSLTDLERLGGGAVAKLRPELKKQLLFNVQNAAGNIQGTSISNTDLRAQLSKLGITEQREQAVFIKLVQGGALAGSTGDEFALGLSEFVDRYNKILEDPKLSHSERAQYQEVLDALAKADQGTTDYEFRKTLEREIDAEKLRLYELTGNSVFLTGSNLTSDERIVVTSNFADIANLVGPDEFAQAIGAELDPNLEAHQPALELRRRLLQEMYPEDPARWDNNEPLLQNLNNADLANPLNTFGRLRALNARRTKAKAASQAAGSLSKKLGARALPVVAAGIGAGAGVALLGKLLGVATNVAIGAGAGTAIGGIAGFFIGGPVGAAIGGTIGAALGGGTGWVLGGGGSVFEAGSLMEGLTGAKAVASDVAGSVSSVATPMASGGASAATNVATANFLATFTPVAVNMAATFGLAIVSTATLLGITTILIAFMPDADISYLGPQPGEFSRYVDVKKTASPAQMDNVTQADLNNSDISGRTITYTVQITPKNGYSITPLQITDTFSYLGKEPPRVAPDLPDSTEKVIDLLPLNESFTDTITLTYQVLVDDIATDVLVVNSFNMEFKAQKENEEITEVIRATASVKIGDPELGCFVFGEAGRTFTSGGESYTTKAWTSEEQNRIMQAYFNRAGTNVMFETLACSQGDITIYRLSGTKYGGWKISPNIIALYDLSFSFQGISSLEYTLVHELGHIIDSRNDGYRNRYKEVVNPLECYTYPYGCTESESFAEGIVLYLVHNTYTSFKNGMYDFDGRHPRAYYWLKDNVYGGVEY